jgi:4-amino-4-deoxy-L-arabinose transferase-like glycosyltransferase
MGPLSHHEVLYTLSAREMLADGDWLVPHNLGMPWTEKPPGVQWIYALAVALSGSTSEIVVRLPSVLAGAGLACLVAALAARWFGPLAGLLSGLIQGTTLYTLRLAPLAEVEMHLTLVVAGAMACFLLACVDGPRGRSTAAWLPWLFYLCVAASCLLKGLVGPCFVLGACVAYTLWQRDRGGVRFLLNPVGISLGLAALLAWAVPAYLRCPSYLDDLVLHHFGRMRGELGGGKNSFYYLYTALFVLLPWTPAVVWGLAQAWRERRLGQPFWKFALCWLVPGLALLCASAFKKSHYLSPLLPPLTILAALGLVSFVGGFRRRGWPHFSLRAVPVMLGCLIAGAAIILGECPDSPALVLLVAIIGTGLLASIYFENRGHGRAYLISLFGFLWLAAAWCHLMILPQYNSYREQTQFARRINACVPADTPLVSLGVWQEQIFYYLQSPARYVPPGALKESLPRDETPIFVLAPEQRVAELEVLGAVQQLDQCSSMRWYQVSRGGRLTLYRLDRRTPQAADVAEHPPVPCSDVRDRLASETSSPSGLR